MAKDKKMEIYQAHREPPKEALKPINAGRLKGMSDINPMWRIKALTETFGACGIGWYYTVDKQWIEPCGDESVAFVNISLYIKEEETGEWSKPIFGTGGSKLIAQERNGKYVSDEAYKMATTDAISVACKQLGIAADVYFQNDRTRLETKYDSEDSQQRTEEQLNAEMAANVDKDLTAHGEGMTDARLAKLNAELKRTGVSLQTILETAKVTDVMQMSEATYISIMNKLHKTKDKA